MISSIELSKSACLKVVVCFKSECNGSDSVYQKNNLLQELIKWLYRIV